MMFLTPLLGFFSILLLSLYISMVSHSLFFFWLSLEINMISVMPLFTAKESFFSDELALKYFISQSVASIMFLALSILFLMMDINVFSFLLSLSIVFKMGVPPFQSWFTSIIMTSPLSTLWLMSTMQKFIPLQILSQMVINPSYIFFLTSLIFVYLLLSMKNIFSLRMALIMSAFGNSAWMLSSCFSSKAWMTFLVIYATMLAALLVCAINFSINSLTSLSNLSPLMKLLFASMFLNLASLPPFSGFLAKLILLKSLIATTPLYLILMLVMTSLLVLFSYLSISFYAYTKNSPELNYFQSPPFPTILLAGCSMTLFPLMSNFIL
uniref:NADH-ubiquinone oxidoreductase chain 2 n=1 Tax=Lovenula raynerae TaxID=2487506 RepID=A0A3G4YLG7_9MAXI|nr:NADH dehydrogenase subunit 2 [Lovenula raynerae]